MLTVVTKRVYDLPDPSDGVRVLVDRLWPRGLAKEQASADEWLRDLAPSDGLRRWYHSHPDQWAGFRAKYLEELSLPGAQSALKRIYQLASKRKRLTLLFASKDVNHNNATVLKELLDGLRKPPIGTGPGAISGMRRRAAPARRR